MRHRAPTLLSRARDLTARRGLAAGAVAVLGVSACAGLVALDGPDLGSGDDDGSVSAGAFPDLRTGTTYPGAAALETMAAERSKAAASRGDARTSPSDKVSEAAEPEAATPEPPAGTPAAPRPDAPNAGDPSRSADPTPDDPAASSPAPSSPESSAPASSTPGPSSSGSSSPSPEPGSTAAPAPAPAPETTAVTDVSAAGTWTVVLSSDQVASFECSLDGGAWTPCGPVATFTGLSQGRHTLAVRAVDGAGTADPTPAQLSTQVSGPLL